MPSKDYSYDDFIIEWGTDEQKEELKVRQERLEKWFDDIGVKMITPEELLRISLTCPTQYSGDC